LTWLRVNIKGRWCDGSLPLHQQIWPASAAGFVLESTPTLGSTPTWSLVAGSPNPIPGAGSTDINTSSGSGAFYRLRK